MFKISDETLKLLLELVKTVLNSQAGIALMTYIFVWFLLTNQLSALKILPDIAMKLDTLIAQNSKVLHHLIISKGEH